MLTVEASTQDGCAPLDGTLDDWLDWQLHLHASEIELGLDRVEAVAQRLHVLPLDARCVVVAGTNGKGSCVRLLESMLQARGHRVGTYTSPHLWRYNERVCIDGKQADDASLCEAFAAVESARNGVPLTFFEYGTLAALWLFQCAGLDYVVLEVGLGGRLDAVNIVEPDVALITNVGLDHTAFLGDTREAVGFEKAGVMRHARPVVYGEAAPPDSVIDHAGAIGAPVYRPGEMFEIESGTWHGWSDQHLPLPQPLPAHVLPENLAASLAVMTLLGEQPRSRDDILPAFRAQQALRGRCEVVDDGAITHVYDVAHNAEAVAILAAWLRQHPVAGATHVVIGMLSDKPVEQVGRMLAPEADCFYTADLAPITPRGMDSAALAERLGYDARPAGSPAAALASARATARTGDRIVVCGSFFMIAHARMEV